MPDKIIQIIPCGGLYAVNSFKRKGEDDLRFFKTLWSALH